MTTETEQDEFAPMPKTLSALKNIIEDNYIEGVVTVADIPAGVWDNDYLPLPKITITETLNSVVGTMAKTPQELFNTKSTALSNPGSTYYVSTTGSDAANGLTSGTAFRSLWKAVDAANAAGLPARVNIASGNYSRANAFVGGTNAGPLVDMAFVVDQSAGYRATTGTWDVVTGFAADATYTKTYSKAVANCTQVIDRLNKNRFGNSVDYPQVATATLCNDNPGTWALVAGVLYIHRTDGAAPTETNTRYFRDSQNFRIAAQVNVYMSGIDFQGSNSAYNVYHINSPAITDSNKNLILNYDCSFKHGGVPGTAVNGRGIAAINWYGAIINVLCNSSGNANDGFNLHNPQNSDKAIWLNFNCTGFDNGRNIQSVNGLTLHEYCRGIDIAGVYDFNRGGSVHNIDNSKIYMLGTTIKNDQGDAAAGGAIPAVAVRMAGSAEAWCERVRIDMPPGTLAYQAAGSTSKIHQRNCPPVKQPNSGPGTIDTY